MRLSLIIFEEKETFTFSIQELSSSMIALKFLITFLSIVPIH